MSGGATASEQHSSLVRAGLAGAFVATAGFVGSLVGLVAGLQGFKKGESSGTYGDVVWFMFSLGGLVAVVCAATALVRRRRPRSAADARTSRLILLGALGGIVLFVVIAVVRG